MLPCVWAAAARVITRFATLQHKVSTKQLQMKTFPITADPTTVKKFSKKSFQGKICLSPYVSVAIDTQGNVFLCGCVSWMPTVVGNVFKQPLDQILSNSISQDIRRSIADGSYEYCNENTCGVINSGQLNPVDLVPQDVLPLIGDYTKYKMPNEIVLAGDQTCNLSCPSCRTGIIKNSELEHERNLKLGQLLMKNIFSQPSDADMRLHVSTSGELFASPMLTSFVSSIPAKDFPNLRLCIQTNGIMVPHNWHKLGDMQNRVSRITVTVDAARPDTYVVLRRGGTWEKVTRAMEWIRHKKTENGMKYILRMVVQQNNYSEIVEFYEMAKRYDVDLIEYTRISNWGTFTHEEFKFHDVFEQSHPEYHRAQEQLDQVKLKPDVFIHGGLF